jgi:hypothetical protein
VGFGAGQQPVKDIDNGTRLDGTGAATFVQRCHKERAAAFGGKRAGDRLQAQAVGVGFQDASGFGLAGLAVQPRPVRPQSGEVDVQNGPRFGRNRLAAGGGAYIFSRDRGHR